MGVLNVTPDSFSDGGHFFDLNRAVAHAESMVADGADIIDIGGESTRPGAAAVPADEELRRTIPVIEALASRVSVPISIDTCKSAVAERALQAGAAMVNDISGLNFDSSMANTVATYHAAVCLMHIKGSPKTMQKAPTYEALIPEIMDALRRSILIAIDAGIGDDQIVVDPGIGFGKTFDQNLQIINRLSDFTVLGKPVLVGTSRKAFIGAVLDGAPPEDRLEGTLAAVALSAYNGAAIVRVHDVKAARRLLRVVDAVKSESMP
ncbi:MAG TPA: dihydropteroate synthase [Dissulfurispiraceae bacterium]|nr:dihydropteroate synthase [Dissulfurispiraceae bacterium]